MTQARYEPAEWLEHYAPGYGHLSTAERRALSDFVLLWSLFEGQVLARNATIDLMFAAIEGWQQNGGLDEERVGDAWQHFVERYTADGKLSGRFGGLRLNRPEQRQFLQNALLSDAPDIATRHKALALIIYRLRNNLLHGEKWSYGLAEQEPNFRSAGQVLMVWMDVDRGF